MKQLSFYPILCLLAVFLLSCSAPRYFHDPSSRQRQQELRNTRSGNVFADIFIGISSVCLSAALDTDLGFEPQDRQFKKINLVNTTKDTMYVNMLTDIYWDESDYCDFMDIRIPPLKNCKVMVPLDATYNLYFSATPQGDDDEMMEILTNNVKTLNLKPGITTLKTESN